MDGQAGLECRVCGKIKNRECDLRKHMKRHTRPYGCTFPHCYKRFGSRNDWKRHESTQHVLQDMWRCGLPLSPGSTRTCGTLLYDRRLFAEHLRRQHADPGRDNGSVETDCAAMHLGANAYGAYWCGFCMAIQRQRPVEELPNALEARAKHIGDHYDKADGDIDRWVCIAENRPKGQLYGDRQRKAKMRTTRPGKMEEAEDDGDLGDDGIALPSRESGYTVPTRCMLASESGMAARSTAHTYGKKRPRLSPGLELDAANVSDDDDWRAS
ncbi:hypothetical protein LTR53_015543 [Teratosphaeriaceae sp. CCFEE 6253]|nr:hypothetical protein LTR53_015543 [Teratosphaeriaceae sp. CCFEE 6253]